MKTIENKLQLPIGSTRQLQVVPDGPLASRQRSSVWKDVQYANGVPTT